MAALGAVLAALWAWFRPFRVAVEGGSMAPTLGQGDFLVATAVGTLHRGSLVVVGHPRRPGYDMVKRVAGLPGEDRGGRTLGRGEYWLAGDDPDSSTDSRTFGPVPREAIRGVIRARYWPRPRWFGSGG